MLIINFFYIITAYFIGAIPTGYLFAKIFFGIDITKRGSKNIGATNIGRILGTKYFFLIFFIDLSKAFSALYFLDLLFCYKEITAMFLLLGNCYSIFLRFKGGKGVATFAGILLYFDFFLFLYFVISWVFLIIILKRAAIASILSVFFVSILFFIFYNFNALTALFLFFSFSLILFRHKENINNYYLKS